MSCDNQIFRKPLTKVLCNKGTLTRWPLMIFLLSFTFFFGCSPMTISQKTTLRTAISARIIGNGAVNVVLVHGIAANKETWEAVVRDLEKSGRFKIHLLDLLGHGSFVEGITDFTPEAQADFLHDYLISQNLRDPIIVGHSYGGIISLLMQIRHERQNSKLILINSPIFETDFPIFVKYFRSNVLSSIVDALTNPRMRVLISLRQLYFDARKIRPETISIYEHLLTNQILIEGIRNASRNINKKSLSHYSESFSSLKSKMIFVRSKQDTVTNNSILEKIRHSPFQAKVVEIDHCGHNAHEECPTKISEIIMESVLN